MWAVAHPKAATMFPGNPVEPRYNNSDKLAIALACLGVAVAIAILLVGLFLDEPIVLVVLLVLFAACFVYPIQHFVRRVPVRLGNER